MSKNDGKQCHYTKKMDGAIDVVGEAFAAVRFPSMPCHLWRVVKVEGWWHNGQDACCPSCAAKMAALHTADSIRGGLRGGLDSAIIPPHERKGDCDGAGGHRARDSRL